jgi:hypothetical protein
VSNEPVEEAWSPVWPGPGATSPDWNSAPARSWGSALNSSRPRCPRSPASPS